MSDKKRVLIVDDEYAFCKTLKVFFEKQGFEAHLSTNGEQAMDMIKDLHPDFMTLDIRMPGINGYEVLEKTKWVDDNIKIIVISAIDVPTMEDSLMRLGAKAVINKPVDLNNLLDTVKRLLS
ncbi:MAG: response regulator [Thermodesulfovibrionales bacterium]